MNINRRKQGTGSICCIKGRWHAYGPGRKRPYLGGFGSQFEATRYLDKWIKEQATKAVAA